MELNKQKRLYNSRHQWDKQYGVKTKKGLTPQNMPVFLIKAMIIVRDYSRQFLQTGPSPANAFSDIDIISPSQNFLLSQDNVSSLVVKEQWARHTLPIFLPLADK